MVAPTPRPSRIGRSGRVALVAPVLALALALGACTSSKSNVSSAPGDLGCSQVTGGKFTITARNNQWNTACIKLTGTSVTFTVVNDDHSVLHNLNVKGAPGTAKTQLAPGPVTQTLALHGLTRGQTYTYICDLHSNMVGQLEVQ